MTRTAATALAALALSATAALAQPPAALETELAAAQPLPATPDILPVGLPSDLLLRRFHITVSYALYGYRLE